MTHPQHALFVQSFIGFVQSFMGKAISGLVAFYMVWLLAATDGLAASGTRAGDKEDAKENWIALFNGKDLTGWTPKFKGHNLGVNYKNTFRVVDGLLTVSYDQYEKFGQTFGHLFHEKSFSNYRLRAEYRFIGDQVSDGPGWAWRNNGLMLHGQTPESMTLDQDFPDSIEVQLLGGRPTGQRSTANLCTPGTHVVMKGRLFKPHCTTSTSKTYRGDQWVVVEIEVRGNTIRHLIEGKTVLEYTNPQLNDGTQLTSGTISIQAESHPCQFRRIELLELGSDHDPSS